MLNFVAAALIALAPTVSGQSPDGIKRLDFLVGHWTSTEKMTPRSGEPVTITLHGKNGWALGETALQIEESFDYPGYGTVHNLIVMTYDAKAKSYLAHWFTNANPRPLQFSGSFDGPNFVLESVRPAGSPGQDIRITYNPKSKTEVSATLEAKVDDKWVVRTEAKYVKDP